MRRVRQYDKCHTHFMIVLTTGNKPAPVYLNHEQLGRNVLPNKIEKTNLKSLKEKES